MNSHSIPKRVEAWFKLSPNVRLDLGAVIGAREKGLLKKDQAIVIGARSTGFAEPEMGNVFHEMGHMIDIDDRRVRQPGWGLRPGKWVSFPTRYSHGFWEAQTDAAVRREVRVMAIQAVIMEHCGFNFDYVYWAALLSNGAIPNYFLWRKKLGLEYEDEKGEGEDGPAVTSIVDAGIIRALSESFSVEDLWAEWVRKCKVVDQQILRARRAA